MHECVCFLNKKAHVQKNMHRKGEERLVTMATYEVLVRHLGCRGEMDTAPSVVGIKEKIEVHSQVTMGTIMSP